MLEKIGSSIGASFRPFEGYFETLDTLQGILKENSRSAVAKHPDDIRALREEIIEQKINNSFLNLSREPLEKGRYHKITFLKGKGGWAALLAPFPKLITFAKKLFVPAIIEATKFWMRLRISDRFIEKALIGKDIESVFAKFSATLAERIDDSSQLVHQKLTLPDLLDIQRTLKLKESFDHATMGELDETTKLTLEKLSSAFKDQNDPTFYRGVDSHTAAVIRNISHEILEKSESERIPAYWGNSDTAKDESS